MCWAVHACQQYIVSLLLCCCCGATSLHSTEVCVDLECVCLPAGVSMHQLPEGMHGACGWAAHHCTCCSHLQLCCRCLTLLGACWCRTAMCLSCNCCGWTPVSTHQCDICSAGVQLSVLSCLSCVGGPSGVVGVTGGCQLQHDHRWHRVLVAAAAHAAYFGVLQARTMHVSSCPAGSPAVPGCL